LRGWPFFGGWPLLPNFTCTNGALGGVEMHVRIPAILTAQIGAS
jgi:hypothetical protein